MKIHALALALLGVAALLSCGSTETEGDPDADAADGSTARCALCEKPIPAGAEVRLEAPGEEPRLFRCVHCALTAQAATPAPSTVRLKATGSGAPLVIRRTDAGWSVDPPSAVFLSLPESAGECLDRHRAFRDRDDFDRYLAGHPELSRSDAVPYGIDRLAELLASGLPADGTVRPDAPVQLLVVGMVTHLPFKESVLPAIEGALEDAGERVGARFVDATRPEGKAILAAHGIREHLPVVMFLNGTCDVTLGGRAIGLRGFPGESTWTRGQLAEVLRREVARR